MLSFFVFFTANGALVIDKVESKMGFIAEQNRNRSGGRSSAEHRKAPFSFGRWQSSVSAHVNCLPRVTRIFGTVSLRYCIHRNVLEENVVVKPHYTILIWGCRQGHDVATNVFTSG
jgi:hypothetical protein